MGYWLFEIFEIVAFSWYLKEGWLAVVFLAEALEHVFGWLGSRFTLVFTFLFLFIFGVILLFLILLQFKGSDIDDDAHNLLHALDNSQKLIVQRQISNKQEQFTLFHFLNFPNFKLYFRRFLISSIINISEIIFEQPFHINLIQHSKINGFPIFLIFINFL